MTHSSHKARRIIALFLLLAGAACVCCAGWQLQGLKINEYAVLCAPPSDDEDETLQETVQKIQKVLNAAQNQMPGAAMTASVYRLQTPVEKQAYHSAIAALNAVLPGYFDVYFRALVSGRILGTDELEQGALVALIDENLANKIYRDEDPLGKNLTVLGSNFTVVGVFRHQSLLSDYEVCIPLQALPQLARRGDSLIFGALDDAHYSQQIFLPLVQDQYPGGTEYQARRDRERVMLPVRCLGVVVLAYILFSLLPVIRRTIKKNIRAWREKSSLSYPGAMILPSVWLLLKSVLICGAWVAAMYGALQLAVAPAYVFPEFVPSNLFSLRSWSGVLDAWRQSRQHLVTIATERSMMMNSCSTLVHAGCILALLAHVILLPGFSGHKDTNT